METLHTAHWRGGLVRPREGARRLSGWCWVRGEGDTNGQGSQAFGAGWDVLTAAGHKIEGDGS